MACRPQDCYVINVSVLLVDTRQGTQGSFGQAIKATGSRTPMNPNKYWGNQRLES